LWCFGGEGEGVLPVTLSALKSTREVSKEQPIGAVSLREQSIVEPNCASVPDTEMRLDRVIHAGIGQMTGGFSPMGLIEAWVDWTLHLAASPARVGALAARAMTESSRLVALTNNALVDKGQCVPCEHSLPQDRRFRDESWQQLPFALYAEALIASERWWDEATRGVHGATPHHLALLNFVARQALDLVSPSNFPLTNPEILRAIRASKGLNLIRGAAYAAEDLSRILRQERPARAEAFEPGKTVALTPGRVVHRTRLAEIIQYEPTTKTVWPEPIVIVPAWIMKYYILDLSATNSLVKHLVDQGFTVFMISWKNPGPDDSNVGFDDYRTNGVIAAIEAATAITNSPKVHGVGYCIGGTLLAVTAAAMARDEDDRLSTMSLLAAQTDFEEAGELRLFVDESQLAILDDMMAEKGVLEASRMAGTFHLLRSNDLIWSRMLRRYFLGKGEEMSDIEAWSTDATRLPARMHSEYLRSFYLDNDFAEGRLNAAGHTVSLQDLKIPLFAVGAEWDHVAPWCSVYNLNKLTNAEVTFALTNGGHNQGIVSPPGRADRHFRIGTASIGSTHVDADKWFDAHTPQQGSWWPAWFDWLGDHSGPLATPPPLGNPKAGFAPGEAAPGMFVHG
jgi:polyhydroxyalkanoate synthase subunit PhaC